MLRSCRQYFAEHLYETNLNMSFSSNQNQQYDQSQFWTECIVIDLSSMAVK